MKIAHENEHLVSYIIDSFIEINNEILNDFYRDEGTRHIAFFSEQNQFKNLDHLKKTIDKEKYFIQTGFQKLNPTPMGKPNEQVKSKTFVSKDEMVKLSLQTLEDFFSKEWEGYVSDSMIEEYKYYFQNVFTPELSLGVWKSENLIGLTNLFPSQDGLGRDITQMGWGWVSPDLDKDLREAVHYEMTKFYSQTSGRYQAGTHIFNERSQKFLNKICYECICVHILKK